MRFDDVLNFVIIYHFLWTIKYRCDVDERSSFIPVVWHFKSTGIFWLIVSCRFSFVFFHAFGETNVR